MPKSVSCPGCQTPLKTMGANPHLCNCGMRSNIVTRTLPIRLTPPDEEKVDKLIKVFYQMGTFFLQSFFNRWQWMVKSQGWMIIERSKDEPKPKTVCENEGCNKNTSIIMGQKQVCSSCGLDYICGKCARQELIHNKAKTMFEIPRLTFIDLAYNEALSMFQAWLKKNWGDMARRGKLLELQECKKRMPEAIDPYPGQKITELTANLNEDELCKVKIQRELGRIRTGWREILAPMSPFTYVQMCYLRDRNIKQQNRTRRRKRLLEIGKLTDVAMMVAEPTCQGCEHQEKYDWGHGCKLEQTVRKFNRLTALPTFPQTRVKISKDSYKIDLTEKQAEVAIWEKGSREIMEILGVEFLQHYDVEFSSEKYPSLHRIVKGKGKRKKRKYYLLYPITDVVPIKEGSWQHVVAFGPLSACVTSQNPSHRQIKHFIYPVNITAIKNYYARQRQQAQEQGAKTYFRRPRDKGSRIIKTAVHTITKEVANYLAALPGKVAILNFKKALMPKGTLERQEINRSAAKWNDSLFRLRITYKLELAGLEVVEQEFDANTPAICPHCGSESSETWQALVTSDQKILSCPCGEETDLIQAIGMVASDPVVIST